MVVEETQLQKCICLSLLVALFVGNIEQVFQVFDSSMDVSILGVDFSQLFVSFASLGFIIGLLAKVEEFVKELYSFFEVAQPLVDVADFLVAFCLLIFVLGALGGV